MKQRNTNNIIFIFLFILMVFLPIFLHVTRFIEPRNTNEGEKDRQTQPITTEEETTQTAKEEILAMLPKDKKAGILHENNDYRIEYIESLDVFKIEVVSSDVANTKKAGNKWFLDHGMTQAEICELPVRFYLNYGLTQDYPELKKTFTPLPDEC